MGKEHLTPYQSRPRKITGGLCAWRIGDWQVFRLTHEISDFPSQAAMARPSGFMPNI